MKKQHDRLGIVLAATVGVYLLACMLLCTFLPRIILPKFDITVLVALSLVALLLDHYLLRGSRRDFRFLPLYGALIFGLFPLAATFLTPLYAAAAACKGALFFPILTWLFDAIIDRLEGSPATRVAPVIGAFGLFLATQCLEGLL